MPDQSELQRSVENAVAQVGAQRIPDLQNELVSRVLEALPAAPASATVGVSAGALLQALADIQACTTQKEILKTLLDGGSVHCARIGFFVVKGGAASGWQAR